MAVSMTRTISIVNIIIGILTIIPSGEEREA